MIFEKATANDTQDLIGLRIAFLLEDEGVMPESTLSLIADQLPAYFRRHLNKDLFIFVCRDAGTIVGCCFLSVSEKPANPRFINGKTGTVLNVYTKPGYRRKGVARKLMQMLLAESADLKLDYVELKASESGYPLYRSLGFEDVASKYHPMKYVIDPTNSF